ncbi:hypothetical protein GQ464_010895 [Rhodocaloribacter litoris]|nr:hypothetical protein [Rhodocaloribacter litoris]QXD13965.1 hypothetical protein GQ464_010895 [Rhodocaloribacter litoris]
MDASTRRKLLIVCLLCAGLIAGLVLLVEAVWGAAPSYPPTLEVLP